MHQKSNLLHALAEKQEEVDELKFQLKDIKDEIQMLLLLCWS